MRTVERELLGIRVLNVGALAMSSP
jgi:hypothetical protein